MKKINAVSVIEIVDLALDPSADSIATFPDNYKGRKQAEDTFKMWVKGLAERCDVRLSKDDLEYALDECRYECSGSCVLLAYSYVE